MAWVGVLGVGGASCNVKAATDASFTIHYGKTVLSIDGMDLGSIYAGPTPYALLRVDHRIVAGLSD